MIKTHKFLPLFTKFVNKTKSGARLTPSGMRIKKQSIANYECCKLLLQKLELTRNAPLFLWEIRGKNVRQHRAIQKKYETFYIEFKSFMIIKEGCSDNYVGHNIKMLRAFFRWVNEKCFIDTGSFYKSFYVLKEDVPILTLSLEQLQYLTLDSPFEKSLPKHLQIAKDIFVFGCMVGLRYSDIRLLKKHHIKLRDGSRFVQTTSKKTQTDTSVKLPAISLDILAKYKKKLKAVFCYQQQHLQTLMLI